MPCLIEPNVFRQSSPFTICDLSEWEKAHPGSKPIALEATPFDGEAGRIADQDYSTIIEREAEKLDLAMEDLCDTVAFYQFGDDADQYTVAWHPQEKKFYAFPIGT